MQTSPLADVFRRGGGAVQEFCGSLTRAGGGEELALLPDWPTGQVLVNDASWRAVLEVEGSDARKWLNGMVTANVRDLEPGRWAPSFQLDPKGHILASLDIVCRGPDRFWLVTEESQRAGLEERLRRFVFISKLQLLDLSQQWSGLRLRGGDWAEAWRRSGGAGVESEPGAAPALPLESGVEAVGLAGAPGGVPQLEILAPAAEIPALWERLAAVATPVGSATVERDRILSRVPRYGVDITAAELPQETGQGERLDFTKGCYIGQEIVERIRARGAVHRHWSALSVAGPVAPGSAIEAEGRAVGQLTSIAARREGWLGLGYVRDPHGAPGTRLAIAGVAAEVET